MAERVSIWLLALGSLLAPAHARECRVPEVFFFKFDSAESGADVYARAVSTLERARWWDFVCSHADRIEFHNSPFLKMGTSGWVVGWASVKEGRRVMAIATHGYGQEEIARVMVHEAGHLEHWNRLGRFADESWANQREQEFRETLTGSPVIPQKEINSERFLNWMILIGGLIFLVLLVLDALD